MEIAVDFSDGKRVSAAFKGFTVDTDQSEKNGGAASAPEPFDLFLTSIATCAGYYVLDFCLARDIPSEGIRVLMRTERDDKKKMLGKISIEIQLPPAFPDKYKKAVVHAADACSVKKHILSPPEFEVYAVSAVSPAQKKDGRPK